MIAFGPLRRFAAAQNVPAIERAFITIFAGAIAIVIGQSPVVAQTFLKYSCLDGSEFVMALFPGDRFAHLQLDGSRVAFTTPVSVWNSLREGRHYTKDREVNHNPHAREAID
jgi:hypothetical protein